MKEQYKKALCVLRDSISDEIARGRELAEAKQVQLEIVERLIAANDS